VVLRLEVTIDCVDPARLAPFWCDALRYRQGPASGPYVTLYPIDRDGVPLVLQAVPEAKSTKNRVHLDLYVEDMEEEVARLVALGATRLDPAVRAADGCHWVLLADPEGNELCVCQDQPTRS